MTLPVLRSTRNGRRLPVLRLGALLVVAVVAVAVVRTGTWGDDDPRVPPLPTVDTPPVPVPADLALAYVHRLPTLVDADRRAAFIRQAVLPSRAVGFLELADSTIAAQQERWRMVRATPLAYRMVAAHRDDVQVLVMSRVSRTPRAGGEPTTSFAVTGLGVLRQWNRWWVYLDLGTTTRYRPGDPQLDAFTRVPPPPTP